MLVKSGGKMFVELSVTVSLDGRLEMVTGEKKSIYRDNSILTSVQFSIDQTSVVMCRDFIFWQ